MLVRLSCNHYPFLFSGSLFSRRVFLRCWLTSRSRWSGGAFFGSSRWPVSWLSTRMTLGSLVGRCGRMSRCLWTRLVFSCLMVFLTLLSCLLFGLAGSLLGFIRRLLSRFRWGGLFLAGRFFGSGLTLLRRNWCWMVGHDLTNTECQTKHEGDAN